MTSPQTFFSFNSSPKKSSRWLEFQLEFNLKAITKSRDVFPGPFRQLSAHIRQICREKFPSADYTSVGAFLFLRFYCPAITVPHSFGLLPGNSSWNQLERYQLENPSTWKSLQLENTFEFDGIFDLPIFVTLFNFKLNFRFQFDFNLKFNLKEPPREGCQRNIVLVSKLMQNLANNTLPGNKETYMQKLNEWIV